MKMLKTDRGLNKLKNRKASSLPKLRKDIVFSSESKIYKDVETWEIYDEKDKSSYRIGPIEFEILKRWKLGGADKIIEDVNRNTNYNINGTNISRLIIFLQQYNLLEEKSVPRLNFKTIYTKFKEAVKRGSKPTQLLKVRRLKYIVNWLFRRINTLDLEKRLDVILPYLRFLYNKYSLLFFLLVLVATLALIYLNWNTYNRNLSIFATDKAFSFGMVLLAFIVYWLLNLLAHLVTLKYYGYKALKLGMPFIKQFPLVYSDLLGRLQNITSKRRLAVKFVGIISGLLVALMATWFWLILPDGVLRQMLFIQSIVSWAIALFINLNPLVKNSSYFLLSDLLKVNDLQPRAMTYLKWYVREKILNTKFFPPEYLTKRLASFFMVYAVLVILFRTFICFLLAYFIEQFTFSLLGYLSLILGLIWVIAIPLVTEIVLLLGLRDKLTFNRNIAISVTTILLVALFLFVPWGRNISAPALLVSENQLAIYPPYPVRVVNIFVENGQKLHEGDPIIALSSEDLDNKINLLSLDALKLKEQIKAEELQEKKAKLEALRQKLDTVLEELGNLLQEKQNLNIAAPFFGTIEDINTSVSAGSWLNKDTKIALLVDKESPVIEAYVSENDFNRLLEGDSGYFYNNSGKLRMNLAVDSKEFAAITQLNSKYLSSEVGGPVATVRAYDKEYVPSEKLYLVLLRPTDDSFSFDRIERGYIVIKGERQSLARSVVNSVKKIFD